MSDVIKSGAFNCSGINFLVKDCSPNQGGNYYAIPTVNAEVLPIGLIDRSGTATTTSQALIAGNSLRRRLRIQNIGSVNLGVNETAGTAAIGTPGTYTVLPNEFIDIWSANAIRLIAASATCAFSATEIV